MRLAGLLRRKDLSHKTTPHLPDRLRSASAPRPRLKQHLMNLKPEGGYAGWRYRRVVALRNASYSPVLCIGQRQRARREDKLRVVVNGSTISPLLSMTMVSEPVFVSTPIKSSVLPIVPLCGGLVRVDALRKSQDALQFPKFVLC